MSYRVINVHVTTFTAYLHIKASIYVQLIPCYQTNVNNIAGIHMGLCTVVHVNNINVYLDRQRGQQLKHLAHAPLWHKKQQRNASSFSSMGNINK